MEHLARKLGKKSLKLPHSNRDQFGVAHGPLSTLFNLGFVLIYIPFRIKLDPSTGCYSLHTNKVQRITCAILHISSANLQTFFAIENLFSFRQNGLHLSSCFAFASNIASFCLFFQIAKFLWFEDKLKIETLLNTTLSTGIYHKPNYFFPLAFLLGYFVNCYFNYYSLLDNSKQFYENDTNLHDLTLYRTYSKAMLHSPVTRQLWLLLQCHGIGIYFVTHSFVLVIVYLLYCLGKVFVAKYNCSNVPTFSEGALQYHNLRMKVDVINNLLNSQLISYAILYLAYVCELPDYFNSHYYKESLVTVFLFIFMDTTTWIIAAEFYYMINEAFTNWYKSLCFDLYHRPSYAIDCRDDLMVVQNELIIDTPGLSCRCFKVTYGLLCSVNLSFHSEMYFQ